MSIYFPMARLVVLIALSLLVLSCQRQTDPHSVLSQSLDALETIESASYTLTTESWQKGDSLPIFVTEMMVSEFRNRADTTIGSKYVVYQKDSGQLKYYYDGAVRVLTYPDEHVVVIDDFSTRDLPFRPVTPPFFNLATNLIRYALHTEDSVSIQMDNLRDHWFVRIVIEEDAQVEFFGKATYMPENPYLMGETTSIYELWINKNTLLPYRVRREMSHDISVRQVDDVELNIGGIFPALSDVIPEGFHLRRYGESGRSDLPGPDDMKGRPAPQWILQNRHGEDMSLSDFDSQVILLQITGIGCGPCNASIRYLREMAMNYPRHELRVVAIETWARNLESINNYVLSNRINYFMLAGNDDIIRNYQTRGSVPVFFILDEDRNIAEVFTGYGGETTDNAISNAIIRLLL